MLFKGGSLCVGEVVCALPVQGNYMFVRTVQWQEFRKRKVTDQGSGVLSRLTSYSYNDAYVLLNMFSLHLIIICRSLHKISGKNVLLAQSWWPVRSTDVTFTEQNRL